MNRTSTLIFLLVIYYSGVALAQNGFFDGEAADNAWSSAANWSADTLPTGEAVIANGLMAETSTGDNFTVGNLMVGANLQGVNGNGSLDMNGGTVNATELNNARNGFDGSVTLSNGAILNLTSHLRIARHDGSTGTFEIGGANTEVNVGGQIIVGNNESGTGHVDAYLHQTGGTINQTAVQDFQVANNTFSSGTFNQTAGTLNVGSSMNLGRADGTSIAMLNTAGDITVGNGIQLRQGVWSQTGGTISNGLVNVGQDVNLGVDPGGNGTFNQTAGTLYVSRNLNLGRNAGQGTGNIDVSGTIIGGETITINNGTFTHRAGANVSTGVRVTGGSLNIGTSAGSSGTYLYQGGTLKVGNTLGVGRDQGDGTGHMEINANIDVDGAYVLRNGTVQHNSGDIVAGLDNNNADFNIGSAGGGKGDYAFDGGSITIDRNMNLQNGTFTQQAGTSLTIGADNDGTLNIGTANGVEGTYLQQGGTLTIANNLSIGGFNLNTGVGHFETSVAQSIPASLHANRGTYRQTDGDLVVGSVFEGDLVIGDGATEAATVEVLNGNVTVADEIFIGQDPGGGEGTLIVNGNITTDRQFLFRNGTVNVTGAASKVDVGVDDVNADFNIGNLAGGSGVFNHQGTGFDVSRNFIINKGAYTQANGDVNVGLRNTGGNFLIADGIDEDGTFTLQNGNINAANDIVIGRNEGDAVGRVTVNGNVTTESSLHVRNGFMDQSNGALDVGIVNNDADINIGSLAGGVGTLSLNGTGALISRAFNLNNGSYLQVNGSTTIGARNTGANLTVADGLNESGHFEIQGGDLTVANEIYIGRNEGDGTGHAMVTGNVTTESSIHVRDGTFRVNTGNVDIGTDNVNGDLNIGHQNGGEGTFTFDGGTFGLSRNMNVNKGAFVQEGGTVETGTRAVGDLNIGTDAGEDATFIQHAGTLDVDRNLNLGQSGFATNGRGYMETHGNVTLGGSAQVNRGSWLHDTGNLVIGANDVTPVSDLFVGSDPGEEGTFSFQGGTLSVPNELNVGRNEDDGIGHITLDGDVDIGTNLQMRNGTGSFGGGTLTIGVDNVAADLIVGSGAGGTGTFIMNDGTINMPRNIQINRGTFVQESGTIALGLQNPEGDLLIATDANEEGTFIQNGGTLTLPDRIFLGRGDTTGTGFMSMNGTVEAGDDIEIRRGVFTQKGGDLTVGTSTVVQNSSFVIGTANDWVGAYHQEAGTLAVENNLFFGQGNGNGIGNGQLDGDTTVGSHFLFRRGTVEQGGSVNVGTTLVDEGDFNIATDAQGDATYILKAGGTIDVADRMHLGRSDQQGVGTVHSRGDIVTGDLVDIRTGEFTQTGGSITVGAVGSNAGNPNARTDANFNIATGAGATATYMQHGGSLSVAQDINVGNNAGDSTATFEYRGDTTGIAPVRHLNVRRDSTLRTIVDNTGLAVIETQGAGGNVNLNIGSTWDVDLAGGVFLNGISDFTALEAAGSVNDNSNFSETIWDRNQLGLEVVVLELSPGSNQGVIDMANPALVVADAESGFINLNEFASSRIELLMDLNVVDTTSSTLMAFMQAGGHAAAAIDADTIRLHLDVPDNDAFFAWDLEDFNAENASGVNVTRLSIQVIPEPSTLALCLVGLLAIYRVRRSR